MKFLALKEALDSVIPEVPRPVPPLELPCIPFYSPDAKKQTVVGGDILRTPVDRTAAMVVRKAPWWAQPPESEPDPLPKPEPIPVKPKNRKEKRMMNPAIDQGQVRSQHVNDIKQSKEKPVDALNADLATQVVKRADTTMDGINQLVEKAKDARAALDIMCDYWKKDWMDFMDQSDERLKALRIFRMSFDTETRLLMTSLRDVRQFFLEKTHDEEVAKLKDFVDLCERLQKLKSSGFLDTVADTLIKLT